MLDNPFASIYRQTVMIKVHWLLAIFSIYSFIGKKFAKKKIGKDNFIRQNDTCL